MKWKINNTHHIGSVRTTRKFAWLPTIVQWHKVWLETFEAKEIYYGKKVGWIEYRRWDPVENCIVYPERKLLYAA